MFRPIIVNKDITLFLIDSSIGMLHPSIQMFPNNFTNFFQTLSLLILAGGLSIIHSLATPGEFILVDIRMFNHMCTPLQFNEDSTLAHINLTKGF